MDANEIRNILQPRVDQQLLTGYFWGKFSPQKNAFMAASLVYINDVDYDDYEYLHGQFNGHTAAYFDYERSKQYYDDNSWSHKPVSECIAEGIYSYFSVTFTGIYFEDKWYIIKGLSFYGDELSIDLIKNIIIKKTEGQDFWEQHFKSHQPLTHEINGRELVLRDVGIEEFKDTPYLVAMLKQQKKEKLNNLYTQYFNEEFIIPFFEELRIKQPDKYTALGMLRTNYTMIFPKHKRYCIFCAMVKNSNGESKLSYFVYNVLERKFYKWEYFPADNFSFNCFYGELIINDLKQISDWDDLAFLDSSRTMDDAEFWDKYVFAQQNNQYQYLKEILIPGF